MSETPDYEEFKTRLGYGWPRTFISTLVPGEPQRVPIENSRATNGKSAHRYGNPIRAIGYRMGLKVAIRTMPDGEVWACLLRDEDVNGK